MAASATIIVTKTRTFFGTGSTNYTGTNLLPDLSRPHPRAGAVLRQRLDRDADGTLHGQGRRLEGPHHDDGPVQCRSDMDLGPDFGRLYRVRVIHEHQSPDRGQHPLRQPQPGLSDPAVRHRPLNRHGHQLPRPKHILRPQRSRCRRRPPRMPPERRRPTTGPAGSTSPARSLLCSRRSYSSGAYQYCAPTPIPTLSSMSGGDAGVLELTHQTLDANGNVLETDTFEDNHDDVIGSTPGSTSPATTTTFAGRFSIGTTPRIGTTTTADYGSGDTSTGAGQWKYATIPSRPSSAPTASANTSLVTLYAYTSDSGRLQTVTDPAGTVTKNFYDNLGRKTYVAAELAELRAAEHRNRQSERPRHQLPIRRPATLQQLVAMDPNGTGTLTNNQVTTYLYEDPVDANRRHERNLPRFVGHDILRHKPNQIAYNVDGSLSQKTDQRGVVIAYAYTNNRLLSIQSVTTLATGVDGTVQSIARTYDYLNRVQNITSYAGSTGTGTAVNDIQYAYYNGIEQPPLLPRAQWRSQHLYQPELPVHLRHDHNRLDLQQPAATANRRSSQRPGDLLRLRLVVGLDKRLQRHLDCPRNLGRQPFRHRPGRLRLQRCRQPAGDRHLSAAVV